jgi:hypothetical protein
MLNKNMIMDCEILGEDVMINIYKDFLTICESVDPTLMEGIFDNAFKGDSSKGWLTRLADRLVQIFAKRKDAAFAAKDALNGTTAAAAASKAAEAGITGLTSTAANAVAGAATAASAAAPGVLGKIWGLLKGGVTNLLDPTNLPRVLTSVGGSILVSLIIRALRNRKVKKNLQEAYDSIKNNPEVVEVNKILGKTVEYKYFKY